MALREQIEIDNRDLFLNTDEFAVEVVLDSKPLTVGLKDVSFAEIGIEIPGVYGHAMIMQAVTDDLPMEYVPEQKINLNEVTWTVKDVRSGSGMTHLDIFRYTS